MSADTLTAVPDLERLLDDDTARTCELLTNVNAGTGLSPWFVRCTRPADWVMHVVYPCGHHEPEARFVCNPCKRWLHGDGYDIGCEQNRVGDCPAKAEVRWMELIR